MGWMFRYRTSTVGGSWCPCKGISLLAMNPEEPHQLTVTSDTIALEQMAHFATALTRLLETVPQWFPNEGDGSM